MKLLSKLPDNKKIRIMIVIDIIAVLVLLCLTGYMVYEKFFNTADDTALTAEEIQEMDQELDSQINSLYSQLIGGYKYTIGENKVMVFKKSGDYSGYINEESPNGEGYTYATVVDENRDDQLQIYDGNGDIVAAYFLSVDSDGVIILTDTSDSNKKIPLKNMEKLSEE